MKKLSFIITSLLLTFALMITGSPEVHATTTMNSAYIYDAYTNTNNGVTITIEADTNTITLNGSSSNAIFGLTSLYTANTRGSSLSTSKSYAVIYEYISGSMTGTSSVQPIATGSATYGSTYAGFSVYITTDNYTKTQGYALLPNDASKNQISLGTGSTFTNFVYRLHFIELTDIKQNDINMFTSGSTITSGSLYVTVSDGNTIKLSGSVSAETYVDLSSHVNSALINSDEIYLYTFEFISGTYGTGYNLNPLVFHQTTSRIKFNMSTATQSYSRGIAGSNINVYSVGVTTSQTFTDYTYKIHVQGIDLYGESITPGESTTPPTGVTLSGSYYQDDIYFNEVTENPFTVYPAVYIATTTGDTFDLGILVENMVFVSTSANIRFYIGRSAGGEENIGGVGDFVISKDETNIYITKLIDDVEQEEVYAPLSDFGFLMIETAAPATVTWTITHNVILGTSSFTQTVNDLSLASVPPNPTRAGYDFIEWRVMGTGAPFNFNAPVTQNYDLVAVWEENGATVYEVTFITGGGTAVSTQTVEDGDLATEPTDPLRSGYTFVNWVITGTETVYNFSTPVTANVSLTAVWEESEVTFTLLTFNSNGGTFVSTQVLYEGELPVEPTDPTRSGYTFSGWYKDIALTQAFSFVGDTVSSDTILYAKWTPNTGGGDPIIEEPAASGSVLLYIGIGAAVLAVWAGLSTNKKKGRRR